MATDALLCNCRIKDAIAPAALPPPCGSNPKPLLRPHTTGDKGRSEECKGDRQGKERPESKETASTRRDARKVATCQVDV